MKMPSKVPNRPPILWRDVPTLVHWQAGTKFNWKLRMVSLLYHLCFFGFRWKEKARGCCKEESKGWGRGCSKWRARHGWRGTWVGRGWRAMGRGWRAMGGWVGRGRASTELCACNWLLCWIWLTPTFPTYGVPWIFDLFAGFLMDALRWALLLRGLALAMNHRTCTWCAFEHRMCNTAMQYVQHTGACRCLALPLNQLWAFRQKNEIAWLNPLTEVSCFYHMYPKIKKSWNALVLILSLHVTPHPRHAFSLATAQVHSPSMPAIKRSRRGVPKLVEQFFQCLGSGEAGLSGGQLYESRIGPQPQKIVVQTTANFLCLFVLRPFTFYMSWPGFDVNMAVGETLTGKDEATSGAHCCITWVTSLFGAAARLVLMDPVGYKWAE